MLDIFAQVFGNLRLNISETNIPQNRAHTVLYNTFLVFSNGLCVGFDKVFEGFSVLEAQVGF